jgi:hypothetical protein
MACRHLARLKYAVAMQHFPLAVTTMVCNNQLFRQHFPDFEAERADQGTCSSNTAALHLHAPRLSVVRKRRRAVGAEDCTTWRSAQEGQAWSGEAAHDGAVTGTSHAEQLAAFLTSHWRLLAVGAEETSS